MRLRPLILFLFGYGAVAAQQLPQYSMYMLNPYMYNPGYAGVENTFVATGVYRKQWSNLNGAPVSQHVNAHMPLSIASSGVGIKLDNENIGARQLSSAVLSYNYQYELGRNALIAFGLSAGYMQYTLDGAKLRAPEGTYEETTGLFRHNDPLLPEGIVGAGAPLLEAGLWFQTSNFSAGLATLPALTPELVLKGDRDLRIKTVRHYVAGAAHRFRINDNVALRPSVLLKSDLTQTQVELSTILHWKENIFVGASFRGVTTSARDALTLIGGLQINEKTTLAYAFDAPLSALSAGNRGSHELLLRYSLNRPVGAGKLPPVIYNPRFL